MARLSTLYDRVRDPHPKVIDVMGVLCLVGIGVATEVAAPHQPGYEPSDAFSLALSVLAPLPLLWRRTHPAAVLAITWVTMAVHGLLLYQGGGPFLALLTALYSVAAFGSPRAAAWGWRRCSSSSRWPCSTRAIRRTARGATWRSAS